MENNKKDVDVVETSNTLQSDDRQEKKGFFGTLGQFFKNLFLDIKASFIYNKMKLASILVGIPGVLLGFFISVHRSIIDSVTFFSSEAVYQSAVNRLGHEFNGPIIYNSFDLTAICFFLLMLIGILNLFTSVNMSGKKNLGSVVTATVSTVLMFIVVVVYLFFIFMSIQYVSSGFIIPSSVGGVIGGIKTGSFEFIMVMISCIGSVICSIIGCVLGFINYDRTYKKSDSK